MVVAAFVLLTGCTPEPDPEVRPTPPVAAPALQPSDRLPDVAFSPATQLRRTPVPASPELTRAARKTLFDVVAAHAPDPGDPWALGHGMLALGRAHPLHDGSDPITTTFSRYATLQTVGEDVVPAFPARAGAALVEPHTDLLLKAFTESGAHPTDLVQVQGQSFSLGDLYRHSLWNAWVADGKTGFAKNGFNDAAWALQALSAWAPADLTWTAVGGRAMSMDALTHAAVVQLHKETAALQQAKDRGLPIQKDTRKGIFRYTCGGQHLLQGAAYAVARGFGEPTDKAVICDQLDLLAWRIDLELTAVDRALGQRDEALDVVMLGQRLKFLGHWLETTHKIGASGLCPIDGYAATTQRVSEELSRTVQTLSERGVWGRLDAIKTDPAYRQYRPRDGGVQVVRDLVGDAAHAVRGIDLSTGEGTLAL